MDSLVEKKIKRGIRLLDGRDFHQLNFDNQLVAVYNHSHQFLGTAYLSQQGRGIDWFLSSRKIELTESYFVGLFTKTKKQYRSFENSDLTTAYRLSNQDGDNLGGVMIDRYADFVIFSWYNTFIYQYRDVIINAFRKVYPAIKGDCEKIRLRGLDYESAHAYGQEAPASSTILENGVKYNVFMNDGLMTGIFLDQYDVRDTLINELGLGKRAPNMSSCTTAFSIAAAMGNAIETTSVNLAKRSCELSQAHSEADGLDLSNHHFVAMDIFEYFRYTKRKQLTSDLIVIDPPSFTRSRKQTFSIAEDYHRLISRALEVLSEDDTIIALTNTANLTVVQFKKRLKKGFASVKYDCVRLQQLPSDFTVNKVDVNSNYLKIFTIRVKK